MYILRSGVQKKKRKIQKRF